MAPGVLPIVYAQWGGWPQPLVVNVHGTGWECHNWGVDDMTVIQQWLNHYHYHL